MELHGKLPSQAGHLDYFHASPQASSSQPQPVPPVVDDQSHPSGGPTGQQELHKQQHLEDMQMVAKQVQMMKAGQPAMQIEEKELKEIAGEAVLGEVEQTSKDNGNCQIC